MVDEVVEGSYFRTHWMMSCSPHVGQPTLSMSSPRSQKAGQKREVR
jgi:hypothetical protein